MVEWKMIAVNGTEITTGDDYKCDWPPSKYNEQGTTPFELTHLQDETALRAPSVSSSSSHSITDSNCLPTLVLTKYSASTSCSAVYQVVQCNASTPTLTLALALTQMNLLPLALAPTLTTFTPPLPPHPTDSCTHTHLPQVIYPSDPRPRVRGTSPAAGAREITVLRCCMGHCTQPSDSPAAAQPAL